MSSKGSSFISHQLVILSNYLVIYWYALIYLIYLYMLHTVSHVFHVHEYCNEPMFHQKYSKKCYIYSYSTESVKYCTIPLLHIKLFIYLFKRNILIKKTFAL